MACSECSITPIKGRLYVAIRSDVRLCGQCYRSGAKQALKFNVRERPGQSLKPAKRVLQNQTLSLGTTSVYLIIIKLMFYYLRTARKRNNRKRLRTVAPSGPPGFTGCSRYSRTYFKFNPVSSGRRQPSVAP